MMELELIVRAGADNLRRSLNLYWPARESYEAAEANITVNMASAFHSAGYAVYAETGNKENVARHDLLGIHPIQQRMVVCEFKRWQPHFSEWIASITKDARRLHTFALRPDHLDERLSIGDSFAVLASTVWYSQKESDDGTPQGQVPVGARIAKWFNSMRDETALPEAKELDQLWDAVCNGPTHETAWDAVPLFDYTDANGVRHRYVLIFVVFRLHQPTKGTRRKRR